MAGGSGQRFGGPKQFLTIAGSTVLAHSVAVAARSGDGVVVVVPHADVDTVSAEFVDLGDRCRVVEGGRTRAESVRCGLAAVPATVERILVHDAARPAASVQLYGRVAAALDEGAVAVVPVVPVADTLRSADGSAGTVDRTRVVAVQTPQGFDANVLRAAHSSGGDATDDATLVEMDGHRVVTVPGERHNVKITEPADAVMLEPLLATRDVHDIDR